MEREVLQLLQKLNDGIPDDVRVDLLSEGIIDSFDIANIVSTLEDHFDIDISAEDIVPENFINVKTMVTLIQKYMIIV